MGRKIREKERGFGSLAREGELGSGLLPSLPLPLSFLIGFQLVLISGSVLHWF
jgi:hypothetical protein